MNSQELTIALQGVLDDKKAEDIQVIDLIGRATFTDFFIVATGTSTTHVAALADEVDRCAHEHKVRVLGVEGLPAANWVLIDIGDVIVHIFQREIRTFYDIEKLWSAKTWLPAEQRAALAAAAASADPPPLP